MLFRDAIIAALKAGEIVHSGMPPFSNDMKKDSVEFQAWKAWCDKYVRECSIDLTLGTDFWVENGQTGLRLDEQTQRFIVDTSMEPSTPQFKYWNVRYPQGLDDLGQPRGDKVSDFLLGPKRYCLARTEHIIGINSLYAAEVSTRSTAGRWGLCVRRSAGLIDPGYKNYITLEVHNDTTRMFPLKPQVRYAQIKFFVGVGSTDGYKGGYNRKGRDWLPEDMLPKALRD